MVALSTAPSATVRLEVTGEFRVPSALTLLEHSADAFFVCDCDAMLRWTNRAFRALIGIDPPLEPPLLVRSLRSVDRRRLLLYVATVQQTSAINRDPIQLRLKLADNAESAVWLRLGALDESSRDLCGLIQLPAKQLSLDDPRRRILELESTLRRLADDLVHLGFGRHDEDARIALPAMLPERQREVMDLMLAGLNVREIAVTLHLSPHTVRNHQQMAQRTLGVHSHHELFSRYRSSTRREGAVAKG